MQNIDSINHYQKIISMSSFIQQADIAHPIEIPIELQTY